MGFRNLLVKAGLAVGKAAAKFDPSGIASSLLDAYSKHEEKKQLRSEIEEMISAGFDKFRDELKAAMGELKQQLPESTRSQVEAFLSQLQSSAKQASRALGDPSGTTVPVTVAVDEPEQLAAFLPQRPPRFVVGNSVPGLPSWKLVEPLGAGGFGEVWKAEHPYSGAAAFKFFHDPTARTRFTHTEAANLAEIFRRAPTDGVVKLLNAEPAQDPPWLKFEYIDGGDLSRLSERWRGVPAGERIKQADRVIRTLARTAGHFHSLGVVHRDLKPSNILLRKSETGYKLVIADFGISKLVPTGGSALPTPANSGAATIRAYTALYASPQQKKFQPADRRDDVYALGVLWYQLLRADLSLERPSGEGWKRALKNLGVSEATVTLLNRCWDDEPDERPADGSALLDAIRQLDPQPTQAPVPVISSPQSAAPAVPVVPAPPPKPTPPPVPNTRTEITPPAPVNVANEPRALAPVPGAPVGETPPPEPATELTVEDAIRQFESEGGQRGATATVGHQYYGIASQLRFRRCRCASEDSAHNAHEFIARNARGTCYHVTHNLRTHKITITTQGYHRSHDVPECIPGSGPRSRSEPTSTEVPPARTLPRTGRVLAERDITPRGTWLVELSGYEDDDQRNENDPSDEEDAESAGESEDGDEEGDGDNNWHIVCFTPNRTEIREGERYYLRLAPRGESDLVGLDALADLEQLHEIGVGTGADFPPGGYALLTGLRHLRVLNLRNTALGDSALKFFGGLVALQELYLDGTRLDGSAFSHLTGLLNLETLDLSRTPLRHADFGPLARLPKLESLWLSESGLKDSDLRSLCAVPGLKTLVLGSTAVTDAGLECCKRIGQLRALALDATAVTDAGLMHLTSCGGLNELSLSGTAIGDDGLARLSGLTDLAHVSLAGCHGVTDEGLRHLRPLSKMESLNLSHTGISNSGLVYLSEMASLSDLSLEGCRVTDAGLMHLRNLTNLEVLNLNGTKVTRKGATELQRALPGCDVWKN